MRDQTPQENDSTLVALAAAGDERAFETLVERHQRQLYRVAYAILQDEHEADVVTQDTFVQAYTHLGKFEKRSQFATWLTRIAINRARDVLRRRRTLRLVPFPSPSGDQPEVDLADSRPGPEQEFLASQLGAAIERAERTLSPNQKVIFRLRHHAGVPLDEIAAQLGLHAATVRVHLFRATRKIRKELEGWRRQPVTETIDVSTLH